MRSDTLRLCAFASRFLSELCSLPCPCFASAFPLDASDRFSLDDPFPPFSTFPLALAVFVPSSSFFMPRSRPFLLTAPAQPPSLPSLFFPPSLSPSDMSCPIPSKSRSPSSSS